MRARVPLTATACLATLLLAACSSSTRGSNSQQSSAAGAPTSASQSESASQPEPASPTGASTAAASSSAPAAGSGSAAVAVNKTINDTVMGETARIIKYIKGFQPSAAAKAKYSALADEQVVLVDMKVTASSKYYDSLGADAFYLTGTPDGIDVGSTTILDADIKAAGYPPLQDADTGKTTTGWVVFTPSKQDAGKLVLRYKRLAAGTSDGKTIPAKNFDVPLG